MYMVGAGFTMWLRYEGVYAIAEPDSQSYVGVWCCADVVDIRIPKYILTVLRDTRRTDS